MCLTTTDDSGGGNSRGLGAIGELNAEEEDASPLHSVDMQHVYMTQLFILMRILHTLDGISFANCHSITTDHRTSVLLLSKSRPNH
jgi:hypothetical protein